MGGGRGAVMMPVGLLEHTDAILSPKSWMTSLISATNYKFSVRLVRCSARARVDSERTLRHCWPKARQLHPNQQSPSRKNTWQIKVMVAAYSKGLICQRHWYTRLSGHPCFCSFNLLSRLISRQSPPRNSLSHCPSKAHLETFLWVR